ncbi:MAG: hypothetical protein LBI30_00790, partial [Holosporales bacterium]|nr:hypothetical protein [Holosporales bacterium]
MGLLIIRAGGGGGSHYPRTLPCLALVFGTLGTSCCSAGGSEGRSLLFYLGFTGNYSDSGAILEPMYHVSSQPLAAYGRLEVGWMVGRSGTVALGGASANMPANNRYKLDDISKDLTAGSTGNGTCAIAGLEFVILRRILMSLEADCNWVDFRKEKQRDPIFDP